VLHTPVLNHRPSVIAQCSVVGADDPTALARHEAPVFIAFRTLVQKAETSPYCFQSLAHSFALMKAPTPFLSFDSALLYQNMGGGGTLAKNKTSNTLSTPAGGANSYHRLFPQSATWCKLRCLVLGHSRRYER
jgi:hypothetical protein